MSHKVFAYTTGLHISLFALAITGLLLASIQPSVASTVKQQVTATQIPKSTRKPTTTTKPALPKEKIHTLKALGYVFVIERSSENPIQYYLRTSKQLKSQRVGVDQPLLVNEKFSARFVSPNLTDDITNVKLETGKLYASILPGTDPTIDGITLAFISKGNMTWCGLDFSTTQPSDELVVVSRLRQSDQLIWRYQVPIDSLKRLVSIEAQGWLETSNSASWIVDMSKQGKQKLTPTPLNEELVLNTTAQSYSLSFLVGHTSKLGGDQSLLHGQTHRYLVRGYRCDLPGRDNVFSSQRIEVSYIEKIR